jgi:low temperature requirement protein LtrA
LEKYSEQTPIRFGHLFKRPLIRQWVLQDKVYRELDDREASQFELFFDLVMVGVIHLLAEAAAEAATGLNVIKFILCFYPAWSVWSDVRAYINVSGTDDVWQRIYILLNMILLVGYSANACGIVIEKVEGAAEEALEIETGDADTGLSIHRRALIMAIGDIVKRSAEGGGADDSEADFVRQIGHTGYWFASGWRAAITSAIGFYLVAKTMRLALYFIYGALLPKFRKALWLHGMAFLIITCIYLPVLFLNRPGLIVILLVAGVVAEIASRYLIAAALQLAHGHAKHKGHKTYMPAYSLPHIMERTTLFTILVIGEVIMSATYTAYAGEHGPQAKFWRASLGIVIAFMLMWLYFDADSSRTFVHGLKRHWFTSITFSNIHFPLCAALVLMGSSMAKMIAQEAVEIRYLWFFSGSIATAMFCIGVIGILHKSLDRWGSSAFPRETRIALRFVMAGVFGVMPLLHHWKSVEFLGTFAAILALAVAFETFGKLGSVGREYDPVRAEQLRQAKMGDEGDDIALADLTSDPNLAEKGSVTRKGGRNNVAKGKSKEPKGSKKQKKVKVKGPSRHDSWHEYDDLTGCERGEDDVGIESELGRLEAKQLSSGERWAYVAT